MTYDREYFESDNQSIGYRAEGYRDFAAHFCALERIVSMKPKSVLEIGGARGYVAKKLIACGIPATVIDISEHCFHTRAVDSYLLKDLEAPPYPFSDKEFDLVFSDSVLEHLHYDKIDDVIKEITRVSNRSLHGIPISDSGQTREEFMRDNTHVILESRAWWIEKFAKADPSHEVVISGNIMGDADNKIIVPGCSHQNKNAIKLNIGSFINMFYYGWINIDVLNLSEFAKKENYIFSQTDMTKPFIYPDGYVDYIFSSHALEHIGIEDGLRFLKECHRMLKTGGVIRIAVPDCGLLMRQYVNNDLNYLKHISPMAESCKCALDKYLAVGLNNHAYAYDSCNLKNLLQDAGFKDVEQVDPWHSRSEIMEMETIVSHPTISLVMEGTK